MDNKILRIAGLQSLSLLLICVLIMICVHNHEETTIQANSPELETESSKYGNDAYELTVAIDPGHGGMDSGTLGTIKSVEEKEINLSIAKLVQEKLTEGHIANVYLSRDRDQYLLPEQRTIWMNSLKPDLCISIHCNSADNLAASGVEVLYHESNQKSKFTSKKLAQTCLDAILEQTGQINRGIIDGDSIYIVRNAKMPIVLVEVGFLSNRDELIFLQDEKNQDMIASGIVNAIKEMKGMATGNEEDSICNDESRENERSQNDFE